MTVVWLARADERLTGIFVYLKEVAGVRTAQKITAKIGARTRILAANPHAGPSEETLADMSEGFRYLVEGNYKIVYYAEGEMVYVVTVFDCRRDPAFMRGEVR